jgi:hypothetical protein
MSFLRTNCTQEGHTYWLYKDPEEGVVRLYDLTVLCKQVPAGRRTAVKNPFALPVAMLLHRIALRLVQDEGSECDVPAVRALLLNVLQLLEGEEDRSTALSAALLLAGLPTITPGEQQAAATAATAATAAAPRHPPPPTSLLSSVHDMPVTVDVVTTFTRALKELASAAAAGGSVDNDRMLLDHAASVYAKLGYLSVCDGQFGRAMRYAGLGLHCCYRRSLLPEDGSNEKILLLLEVAADALSQLHAANDHQQLHLEQFLHRNHTFEAPLPPPPPPPKKKKRRQGD